jgi:hypothetical protein
MLLGILLICYSARGHQLVFAYPSHNQTDSKIMDFEPHFLADLLSPKVPLCDQQFRLTVDQKTFVGHVSLLNADRHGTGKLFF